MQWRGLRETAPLRWSGSGFSADRLVTCYQIHSTRCVTVKKPWRTRCGAARRWLGHAQLRHRPRHSHCRLRPGPVRTMPSPGSSVRRMAAGAARSAELSRRRSTAMEALGAERSRIRAGDRPLHRPDLLRGRAGIPGSQFLAHDPASAAYFAPAWRSGHYMFDLSRYIERRLARAGVAHHRARRSRHRSREYAVFQLSACLSARRAGLWPRALGNRASRLTCEPWDRYAYLSL